MQTLQVAWPPDVTFERVAGEPIVGAGGYGFGLTMVHDLEVGTIVMHGGGYPGFGSNMRWHPASGLGVVAVGNSRYANVFMPAREALRAAIRAEPGRTRGIAPWPVTEAARRDLERLLEAWDEDLAARLFSTNVDLDEPIERRRATLEKLRGIHGRLVPDDSEPARGDSPAHLEWWMVGEHGCVKIEILMSPEPQPKVQTFDVTSVPEPKVELSSVAETIVRVFAEAAAAWPAAVRLGPKVDRASAERELRTAVARYGAARLGRCMAGDGERNATWRVSTDRGELELRIERDSETGELTAFALRPKAIKAPFLADG
jgi:hypothetical protein